MVLDPGGDYKDWIQKAVRKAAVQDQLTIDCFEPSTNSSTTTTSTRRITSTSQPTTHTETQRSPDTADPGQPTSPPGSTAGTKTTEGSKTENSKTGSQICNDNFPGHIFAAGIATGGGVAIVVHVIYLCIISPRYRTSCRKSPAADIPMSPAHPTYAGFIDRIEEPVNNYDSLSQTEVITKPYINEYLTQSTLGAITSDYC